ncbi:MAG: hypothetical protein HY914_07770 [Desulfomonile tiedjei]|nr:hypothetical protein [Desulfomonile tiedjei]
MTHSLKSRVLRKEWRGRETCRQEKGQARRHLRTGRALVLLASLAALVPDLGFTAPPPVETVPGGFFYTVTHLHAIVYLGLFVVFVSSVANLVLQGWLFRGDRSLVSLFSPFGRSEGLSVRVPRTRGLKRQGRDASAAGHGAPEMMQSGILAVRRAETGAEAAGTEQEPTPLDGVDHPMPKFTSRVPAQTGAPRMVDSQPEQRGASQDFRFMAAVDVPSREEMDRREKLQVVVRGSVIGPDGQGIPSVIVYLSDEHGNRLGQSCRTQPDTGEFKVSVHEPGRYLVNAYKRGYILESHDPMVLPIESGKIEGFNIRMLPEGCTVDGRVSAEQDGTPVAGVEVRCLCRAGGFVRSAITDPEGNFAISGIPVNSVCHLELLGEGGGVLTRSEPFETVQKKAIHRSLTLPATAASPASASSSGAKDPTEWGGGTPEDPLPNPGSTIATP